jgi:hypothetical protein
VDIPAEEGKPRRQKMYGKIAALPVTGMGAAVAGPVSVLGFLLIGLTLVFAGTAVMGLLPKLHRHH